MFAEDESSYRSATRPKNARATLLFMVATFTARCSDLSTTLMCVCRRFSVSTLFAKTAMNVSMLKYAATSNFASESILFQMGNHLWTVTNPVAMANKNTDTRSVWVELLIWLSLTEDSLWKVAQSAQSMANSPRAPTCGLTYALAVEICWSSSNAGCRAVYYTKCYSVSTFVLAI